MPGKRTTMRKLRDVLRLRHAAGLSIRDISRSTKLSVGGIQKLLSRAQALQLSWPLPADLDDTRLALKGESMMTSVEESIFVYCWLLLVMSSSAGLRMNVSTA